MKKRTLGICIGASTVKAVEVHAENNEYHVVRYTIIPHECDIVGSLQNLMKDFEISSFDYAAVTGRKFRTITNLHSMTEPQAIEGGMHYLKTRGEKAAEAIVSLGSENFVLYQTNESSIVGVRTGNKCASGTGEFFLQQIGRMNLPLDKAIELAESAEPYKVSGRCSVFCKSDCTHALNKGVPKERVTAGLSAMIADKVVELLGPLECKRLMLVGGVSKNRSVIKQIRAHNIETVIPDFADIFEALGAAVLAHQKGHSAPDKISLTSSASSFSQLAPLKKAEHLVTFQEQKRSQAENGDRVILGLDVGSTTTKAVLLRREDKSILASTYLRTNGNPVEAARNCYKAIRDELAGSQVKIDALGVTGSGRYIAGLHAQTDAVINEIIAHASGAAFYESDVDTILEIGGQDAKYTHLVNGVPCDYAMNEACSAGTGSFLEEAAKESLGIDVLDIQDIAINAEAPPDFNDQCAAFIGSDIRNASHEISRENIVAGLVYSVCMNYSNRVKGDRKIGDKVFMQGGVCYNKAVPLAMASLLQKEIIVPPEPGLTGAFGVAVEVEKRLQFGLLEEGAFCLDELISREVKHGKTFICPGALEHCDRKCTINTILMGDKSYPFGGICNKYYNITHNLNYNIDDLDYIEKRQEAVFVDADKGESLESGDKPRIGILRSFLTNTLYPFYHGYFTALGCQVVLSDDIDQSGVSLANSSFCFPSLLAHGMLANLIEKKPDFYFMPEMREVYVKNSRTRKEGHQSTCISIQGEPYYMASTFKSVRDSFLTPVLSWHKGWHTMKSEFAKIAEKMGFDSEESNQAYDFGMSKLEAFFKTRERQGEELLKRIEKEDDSLGIVIFGRAYNAFAPEANMGIPQKLTSRGVYVIPYDSLPFYDEESQEQMTWAAGQDILRAARFVKKHPKLFGLFVTNFSCGPDSFLMTYFRDIMKTKPSLTIEIDNHTADAGINTRIEAFLDIVDRYRKLEIKDQYQDHFVRSKLEFENSKMSFVQNNGSRIPITDPSVKLLLPSMGRTVVEGMSAVFNSIGIQTAVVSPPSQRTLTLGRANTSCKECLPLTITVGSLLEYMEDRSDENENLLYFMPTSHGNCRLGQYYIAINNIIEKYQFANTATMTVSPENGYAGLGISTMIQMLKALIVGDLMDDIRNTITAIAIDKESALAIYEKAWLLITQEFASGGKTLYKSLKKAAAMLSEIKLKHPLKDAKRVMLSGEIYVRRDEFSSQQIMDSLSKREIVVQRAPVVEWLNFVDARVKFKEKRKLPLREQFELMVRRSVQNKIERKIKKIFASTGLCEYQIDDMTGILKTAEKFVNKWFHGETVLTVGRFFQDIFHDFHGMISIGPFACLPTRSSEAIMIPELRTVDNDRLEKLPNWNELQKHTNLPFLSVETDGKPLPQIIDAQLDAFCLQVERIHAELQSREEK